MQQQHFTKASVADDMMQVQTPPSSSPSCQDSHPERQVAHLPLMLYIPGIDGTGMAASRQFPGLMGSFDFRSFSVPVNDRTPFNGLVQIVK